jgi:ArsR family transcriptional regulator
VARVIAVDGSPDMLDEARRRLRNAANVELRRGSLEALPIGDGKVDVALMGLVLHHVPDPAQALVEAAGVLKPGGRALVIDMLPHDRVEYQQQMGHVWLGFSEKTIKKYLEGAGFERASISTLPADDNAKGPSLFVATAKKVGG